MRRPRITRTRPLIGRPLLARRSWAANWVPGKARTGVAADRGSTPQHPWTGAGGRCDGWTDGQVPTSPSAPRQPGRGHVSRPGRQYRICIPPRRPPNQAPVLAALGTPGTLITNLAECNWKSTPAQANQLPLPDPILVLLSLPQHASSDCDDKAPHGANACRSSRLGCVLPPCLMG